MKYTYICHATGEEKEVSHGMNETPDIRTTEGKKMVKKLTTPVLLGMDNWGRSK